MAKPKIDFKKLMLEKGERIGVGVAGALALLLVALSLFMPGKGLFSGSPSAKAKDLTETATYVKQRLADPNNKPTDADKPAKDADAKKKALDMTVVDGSAFRMAPLGPSGDGVTSGRRIPKVFPVEEAAVKLARLQIQSYIFTGSNPPKLIALKSDGGAGGSGGTETGPRGGRTQGQRAGNFFGGLRPGAGGMGMGMPGMPGGARGMGMRGGAGMAGLRMPGSTGPGGDDGKKDKTPVALGLNDLNKPGYTLAEQTRPVREVIIAASFPYKKELEEFRAKLGLRSTDEVRTEMAPASKGKGSRPEHSFRFLGVNVQRRELDGDGKPLGDFKVLDLKGSYGPYVIYTGARFEDEDPELKAIAFDGLVMRRLKQFRPENVGQGDRPAGGIGMPTRPPVGGKGPDDEKPNPAADKDQYPAVEKELTTLRATLDSLRGKAITQVAAPPSRFSGAGDVFGGSDPDTGNDTEVKNPPLTPPPGGEGAEKADPSGAQVIPEHCLVRVIDVTVEPGKTYEYQLQVRMANPNYGRSDIASATYGQEKELLSEWSKTPLRVQVDPELRYYAVDQKKLEPKYAGPNAFAAFDAEKQVWLQAHRWLETVPIPGNPDPLLVGEWAVAERFSAYRGEYVGRSVRIQLPVWKFEREAFVLANDRPSRGGKSQPQINVDFGFSAGGAQPEAIAVDVDTGRHGVEKVLSRNDEGQVVTTARVTDEAGPEVLLLDPSGRLLLLEGALDVNDKDRKERLAHVRARVKEVAAAGKKTGPGTGTGKPFGGDP